MKLVQFSNKRPASGEQGCTVLASQTNGKLRMTAKAAEIMGVVAGDYIAAVGDKESGINYLYVGEKTEDAQVGNKLAESGTSFEFVSQNVWDELRKSSGIETDGGVKFDLAEEPVEFEGVKYYAMSNPIEVPATTRTKKSEEDSGDDNEPQTNIEEAPEQEVEEDEEEAFSLD